MGCAGLVTLRVERLERAVVAVDAVILGTIRVHLHDRDYGQDHDRQYGGGDEQAAVGATKHLAGRFVNLGSGHT